MNMFNILLKNLRTNNPYVHSYTPANDIPPKAEKINDGLYLFEGDMYIIDMDYIPPSKEIPEYDTYMQYRTLLFKKLKMDRIL